MRSPRSGTVTGHWSTAADISKITYHGFTFRPALTYAESRESLEKVRAEAELAASLGLPAHFTDDVPLPLHALGAVRFDDQAQIHAVAYLQGLARAVDGDGSFVFEGSLVRGVRNGTSTEATAGGGRVLARDVVVATNVPLDNVGRRGGRGSTRPGSTRPGSTRRGSTRRGSTRSASTRRYPLVRRALLPPPFVRRRGAMPADGLPFAGLLGPDAEHVYVITGLRKWGLTNGTAAALAVADLVSGVPTPWAQLFESNRALRAKAAPPSGLASRAASAPPPAPAAPALGRAELGLLGPGQGTVVDGGGEPIAVYADAGGSLRALTAVCTHLGCTVEFNSAQRTWDCPCHGSWFALDGSVIHRPAERHLAAREVPSAPLPAQPQDEPSP